MILSFLSKMFGSRFFVGAILVIVLLLGGSVGVQSYRLHSSYTKVAQLESKLSNERADNQVCKGNVEHLGNSLETQNKAIEDNKKKAEADSFAADKKAHHLLSQPIPPLSGHGASALNSWLESK